MGTSHSNIENKTHLAIKKLVPEFQTGDIEFDHICITDYMMGDMGTDWKDKYNKKNYRTTW